MCAAVTWVTVHVTILHVIYWRGYFTVDKFGHQVASLVLSHCPIGIIVLVSSSARDTWTHRSDQGYLGPIKIEVS